MSDLDTWLRQLGLERYIEVLAENDVDLAVLPVLTDGDLRELGLSLGHRRKLLMHVHALIGSSAPTTAPPPPGLLASAESKGAAPASGPERRQLTVMFADLVDSTRLSQQLDPEELGEILRAYRMAAASAIENFGGYIARYYGDGILVYFGYPEALEDDAERGVRAGLALVQSVAALRPTVNLEVAPRVAARVGIASGAVVVGEEIGQGASHERFAVGETPNLAARLQGVAEPNSVVIAPLTRRLVADSVMCSSLGEHSLKGIGQPVEVWRAEKALDAPTRFERAHAGDLTPLIGREGELGMLNRLWKRTAEGHGQVVLVSGEPGIGKSRLVQTLRERISGEMGAEFVFQCSPLRQNSVLYPVVSQLRSTTGIEEIDDTATAVNLLEQFLARRDQAVPEAMTLLADLLSIPTADRFPPLDLSPPQRKSRTLVLIDKLLRPAREVGPALVFFEDLQWVDPTSLELLQFIVASVQSTRSLVVITYRPPLQIPWAGMSHVSQIALSNLTDKQSVEMIKHVTHDRQVLDSLVRGIMQRTDGVPLFIEEYTRAVLDSTCRPRSAQQEEGVEVSPSQEIPITLRDSLAARLGQLSSAKEVAQQAAVVGREFSFRELSDLTGASEDALREALDRLVRAQIIYGKSSGSDACYSFKHSLVRDAAYQSLLKSSRRELHLRHARALELAGSETRVFDAGVVAQHYLAARVWRDAVRCLQLAITETLAKSANVEALHHIDAALEAVERLDDAPRRHELELDFMTQKGAALRAMEGYAAPQVEQVYRRARSLLDGVSDSPKRFQLEWQQMQFFLVNGDLVIADELAQSLLALAREREEHELALDAYLANGMVAFHRGELPRARDFLEHGLRYYQPEAHAPRDLTHGQDAGVFTLSYLAYTLWFLGRVSDAQAKISEAVAMADRRQHAFSRVSALTFAARIAQCRRDVALVEPLAERLITLTREKGFNYYTALGVLQRGWAQVWRGDHAGLEEMMVGYRALEETGTVLGLSAALLQIADASLRLDDLDRASWALQEAISKESGRGTRCWDAEFARARGELAERRGTAADELFRKAIAISREQSAGSLELRASLSYACCLHARGKIRETVETLQPAMGLIFDGEGGLEVLEARTLLESASGQLH